MDFDKSWRKFGSICLSLLGVVLLPFAYLIVYLTRRYSPLPEYPEITYFLMIGGFSISLLFIMYAVGSLSISLWLKYALKHHTSAEILRGIELKFSKNTAIYKWFHKVL